MKAYEKPYLISLMVISLFMIFSPAGYAATYNLKVGSVETAEGGNTLGWQVFKSYVEKTSNGEIQVELFPNNQLGDTSELQEKLKIGILNISQGDENITGMYDPMKLLQLPYLWDDEEMLLEFTNNSPFWEELNDSLERDTGLRMLSVNPYGIYCFINKVRPVKTIEDLEGLKLRTMLGSTQVIKALEGLGASATPCGWTEIYTSIKTGVLDGLPHTLTMIQDQKFYEVTKYLTLDYSIMGFNHTLVNAKWWNSLPEDIQAIIKQGARMASIAESGISLHRNYVTALEEIQAGGVEVYILPQSERDKFKEAAQKPVVEWMNEVVGEDLVNKMFEAVDEIRKERGF